MELYQLHINTLKILENLRTTGLAGVEGSTRSSGKTTALLLRTQELLDAGHTVYFADGNHRIQYARHRYYDLFSARKKTLGILTFVGTVRDLGGDSGYLLLDEPWLLKWSEREWSELYRSNKFKIESVGSWHPIGR